MSFLQLNNILINNYDNYFCHVNRPSRPVVLPLALVYLQPFTTLYVLLERLNIHIAASNTNRQYANNRGALFLIDR